jgi:hypothetical protein
VTVLAAAVAGAWLFRSQPPLSTVWNRATQMLERR